MLLHWVSLNLIHIIIDTIIISIFRWGNYRAVKQHVQSYSWHMARRGGELGFYVCKCCVFANKLPSLGNSQRAAGNFKQIIAMGWKSAGRGDVVIKLFTNLFSPSALLLVPRWQGPDLTHLGSPYTSEVLRKYCWFAWFKWDISPLSDGSQCLSWWFLQCGLQALRVCYCFWDWSQKWQSLFKDGRMFKIGMMLIAGKFA